MKKENKIKEEEYGVSVASEGGDDTVVDLGDDGKEESENNSDSDSDSDSDSEGRPNRGTGTAGPKNPGGTGGKGQYSLNKPDEQEA